MTNPKTRPFLAFPTHLEFALAKVPSPFCRDSKGTSDWSCTIAGILHGIRLFSHHLTSSSVAKTRELAVAFGNSVQQRLLKSVAIAQSCCHSCIQVQKCKVLYLNSNALLHTAGLPRSCLYFK